MKIKTIVMVVEDQQAEREALARLLRMEQFEVLTAHSPHEAMGHVDRPVGLVISDVRLGRDSGIDLLRDWRSRRPETPFVMLTAFGEIASAVAAMKLGAADYLIKPVDPEALLLLVGQLVRRARPPAAGDSGDAPGFDRLVGRSAAMLDVFDRIERAAQSESLVLVCGESGTGKELAAEAIHRRSRRRDGPFVAMNIAAVPENLVESELFGHVQGAFTGAAADRKGRFEAAHGGTLFIDEIGDCALVTQAKLLRVLETFLIVPVGGNNERKVDVRVVAATSRDMTRMMADREFREDLYYRLNVVVVQLPPLRQRRDDIPLLVDTFLDESCRVNARSRPTLDGALVQWLDSHAWPGNVRQLRNVIESMVVLARGDRLTLDDLPESARQAAAAVESAPPRTGEASLGDLEREAVWRTLHQCGGNRTQAARALGISVRTLQRKLKSWRLSDTQE